jgi:hypothetical protein
VLRQGFLVLLVLPVLQALAASLHSCIVAAVMPELCRLRFRMVMMMMIMVVMLQHVTMLKVWHPRSTAHTCMLVALLP